MSSKSILYAKYALFFTISFGQTVAMEQNNPDRVNKLVETIRELGLSNSVNSDESRSLLFDVVRGATNSEIEAASKVVTENASDKGLKEKLKSSVGQNNSDKVNKLVETIRELGISNIGDTEDTRSILFEIGHGINGSDIEAAWKIVAEGILDKEVRKNSKPSEIKQSDNAIIMKLLTMVENQFAIDEKSRRWEYSDEGQGMNDGAEGFIYFPKNLKTKQQFLDYIDNAKLPRVPMTLKDYLATRKTSQKSLIIGSGLLQEMVQPTLSNLFKDSYYIDPNETLSPDKIDMFGDKSESYQPFYGQFDGIYFDFFPNLYSDQVLTLATSLLKSGGTLKMTYRPSNNGLDLTKEENAEITERNQGLMMSQFNQKFENAKPIIGNAICNKLKNKFKYRLCTVSETKKVFRENGPKFYEIDAIK